MGQNFLLKSLWFLFLFFSSNAFAMYGAISQDQLPQSLCRLTMYTDAPVALVGVCTGTLISATEVATAAHCIDGFVEQPGARMRVECSYKGVNPGYLKTEVSRYNVDTWTQGVEFKETHWAIGYRVTSGFVSLTADKKDEEFISLNGIDDQAIVVLNKPSSLTPARVISADLVNSKTAQEEMSIVFEKCMGHGFGFNPQNTAGLPYSGHFDSLVLKDGFFQKRFETDLKPSAKHAMRSILYDPYMTRKLMRYLIDKKYMTVSADAGDSGGPLICEVNGQDVLVGVLSGAVGMPDYDWAAYHQRWTPLNLPTLSEGIQ